MPTSMRTCASPSRWGCPSQGCAPSSGAASMALVPLRRAGRRCALRLSRALGWPGGRRAFAAFTAPSWT
eukprot:11384961-Alexandrium_andersonii.AAC.1